MAVRRKTIRTIQPSGPVQLDPYWLKRGLVLYDVGNGWIWTKLGGWQGTSSRVGPPRLQTSAKYGAVKGYGTTHGVGTTDRTDGPQIALSTGFRSIVTFSYANSSGGGGLGRIFQKAGTTGADAGDEGWYTNSTNGLEILYGRISSAATGQWGIAGSIPTGQWVGYGLTHDQRTTGTTPAMYKNGDSASVSATSPSSGTYATGNISLDIGNRSTTGTRGWDGMLGPKLIFDHPEAGLTAAEHKKLYENPHQVALGALRRNPGTSGVTLTPSLFTNSNAFYTPTVSPGTVTLTPSLFTNSNTFYTPVVDGGGTQDLTPALFTNANSFYAPTVAPGAVDLTPSLFTNTNTFYTPSVSQMEITDDYERSSFNPIGSGVSGVGDSALFTIVPKPTETEIGTAWLEFSAKVVGVNGFRPSFTISSLTQYYPLGGWETTRRAMFSYDQETWYYFTDSATVGSEMQFRHGSAFTSDTVYVGRSRQRPVHKTGEWLATLLSTYPALLEPASSAVAYTPSGSVSGYAAQTLIADEYSAQTDDLGKAVPITPLYCAQINDTSLMPADGSAKRVGVIFAGTHASEDHGDFSMKAAVEYLLGSSSAAQNIRRQYRVLVYPCMNAPGRAGGGFRGSFQDGTSGADDLNRHFHESGSALEIVDKPRATLLTDLSGLVPDWQLDFHGTYLSIWAVVQDAGNNHHSAFRTKLQTYSGLTVTDDGNTPTGSAPYYFGTVLGTKLAIHVETGDYTAVTDAQIVSNGSGCIQALDSMLSEGYFYSALQPALFTNTHSFYAPTVAPGSVGLTPALFTSSNAFYAPEVGSGDANLTPALFTNSSTFYAATVAPGTVGLTPGLFTNDNTFYSATVTVGFMLTPDLFTNANAFYAAAITVGGVVVEPGLFSNSQLFYAPTVSAGPVDLTPSLFTNTNQFFSPTVADAGVTILPGLFSNLNAFYAATVAPGSVDLTPSLFANTNTFYTQLVSGGASMRVFVNDISVLSVPISGQVSVLYQPSGMDIYVQ